MPTYRNFTSGITFYVSPGMRKELDQLSEERRLTVSELLREILGEYFSNDSNAESNNKCSQSAKEKE